MTKKEMKMGGEKRKEAESLVSRVSHERIPAPCQLVLATENDSSITDSVDDNNNNPRNNINANDEAVPVLGSCYGSSNNMRWRLFRERRRGIGIRPFLTVKASSATKV